MKRFLIGAVMIGAMAAQVAAGPGSSAVVVVVVPGPSWGWVDLSCDGQSGRRFPSQAYACDPLYGGNNRTNYPAPSVIVAMPRVVAPPAPAPTALPALEVRPVIREYHWPSSEGDPDGGKGRQPIDPVKHQARR
jgi:hypothetical protein